jgi:Chaperone of endosialidase
VTYVNIPANLRDMWMTLSDRVAKLENGPDGAQDSADTAQAIGVQALTSAQAAANDAAYASAQAAYALQTVSQAIIKSSDTIVNASNQLTAISGNGITVYSGASSSSGARVVLNSAGLAGFNSSGTATFSIDSSSGTALFAGQLQSVTGYIGGSNLSSGTITGGIIQTSTNSTSIVIDGPNDAIRFKVGGGYVGNIVPLSAYGLLLHYGSSPNTSGTTYPQVYIGSSNTSMGASSSYFFSSTTSGNTIYGNVTATGYIYNTGHTTTGSSANAYINSSTGLIARSTASSQRYKENIVDISQTPELDPHALLQIPVRSFNYKKDYLPEDDQRASLKVPGFIAEEIKEIYPIAVDLVDGKVETWNEKFIIPGLLALIKELDQRVKTLENK